MKNDTAFAEERRAAAAASARSVLVVDDDRSTRAVLSDVLSAAGWTPVTAKNGAEVREMVFSPGSPRVVLLDWLLPDIPGTQLCREARPGQRGIDSLLRGIVRMSDAPGHQHQDEGGTEQ